MKVHADVNFCLHFFFFCAGKKKIWAEMQPGLWQEIKYKCI